MKKIIIIAAFSIIGLGAFAILKATEVPTAKFTARVTDEDGKPLGNIPVRGGFGLPYNAWGGGESAKSGHSWTILTNEHGLVSFEEASTGSGGAVVSIKGYYAHKSSVYFAKSENGKWQPWNPTVELVLRPIIKPIRMYAKKMDGFVIPAKGVKVGFDFEAGDWVYPGHKGSKIDVYFSGHHEKRSDEDYDSEIRISFPNEGDGIQTFSTARYIGSSFISPRFAPEGGYLPEWRIHWNRRPGKGIEGNRGGEKDRYYFLRIRTRLKDGIVESAQYVKVYGEFFKFHYFMNPTPNDRNMEFGGTLLDGLKFDEAPHGP